MGVQVPPFALLLFSLLWYGCQFEVEKLQGESLYHLGQAIEILQQNAGNTDAAVAALDRYLVDHRERMLEVKALGVRVLQRMSPAEREAFQTRALEQTRPLREKAETLARTFSDPPKVLRLLQEFL
ncbi:MAG TPA: hypothetical protein PLQ97_08755 [Myxococcota bacterium]|nr:hypothetical protein [Myxococcota bacterium]HQK51364.1 hypothetical protein [Myxococcota bacterium]